MAYSPEQFQVRACGGVNCGCLQHGCWGWVAIDAPSTPGTQVVWYYSNPAPQEEQLKLLDYLPRELQLRGSSLSIEFVERGRPGPLIQNIINKTVVLDNADDKIFEKEGWRQTKIQVDAMAGATKITIIEPVNKCKNAKPVVQTRQQFMERLAELIKAFVKSKRGYEVLRGHINLKELRLVGAQYYPNPHSTVDGSNNNYR